MSTDPEDKRPAVDPAEDNAFFPSPYSLARFTAPKSDLADADYPDACEGGRYKILMIATDERYLLMGNGRMFSTGNHPIETLVPMVHMDHAGFEIDIATLSGNPAKLELWAFPGEDEVLGAFFDKYRAKFKQPLRLADVVDNALGPDSDYLAVFVPGGHGALIGLPGSRDVKAVIRWALDHDRHIISLCHGPAFMLAAAVDEKAADYAFRGYEICVFPDALDRSNPDIGYMPGPMPWFLAERLAELGVTIVNDDMTGRVHQDRKLITGDSPLASNELGKVAARALIAAASASGRRV